MTMLYLSRVFHTGRGFGGEFFIAATHVGFQNSVISIMEINTGGRDLAPPRRCFELRPPRQSAVASTAGFTFHVPSVE